MNLDAQVNEIKGFLLNGKLEKAIKQTASLASSLGSKKIQRQIFLIESRNNKLNSENNEGVITRDQLLAERNKIISSVLQFLQEVKEKKEENQKRRFFLFKIIVTALIILLLVFLSYSFFKTKEKGNVVQNRQIEQPIYDSSNAVIEIFRVKDNLEDKLIEKSPVADEPKVKDVELPTLLFNIGKNQNSLDLKFISKKIPEGHLLKVPENTTIQTLKNAIIDHYDLVKVASTSNGKDISAAKSSEWKLLINHKIPFDENKTLREANLKNNDIITIILRIIQDYAVDDTDNSIMDSVFLVLQKLPRLPIKEVKSTQENQTYNLQLSDVNSQKISEKCYLPEIIGITPNAKENKFLVINCLNGGNYPDNRLTVFNRWGDIVFEATPYNNDWDGTDNGGKSLPQGAYYYIFSESSLKSSRSFRGNILILR